MTDPESSRLDAPTAMTPASAAGKSNVDFVSLPDAATTTTLAAMALATASSSAGSAVGAPRLMLMTFAPCATA